MNQLRPETPNVGAPYPMRIEQALVAGSSPPAVRIVTALLSGADKMDDTIAGLAEIASRGLIVAVVSR